jgi:hypothetical protein
MCCCTTARPVPMAHYLRLTIRLRFLRRGRNDEKLLAGQFKSALLDPNSVGQQEWVDAALPQPLPLAPTKRLCVLMLRRILGSLLQDKQGIFRYFFPITGIVLPCIKKTILQRKLLVTSQLIAFPARATLPLRPESGRANVLILRVNQPSKARPLRARFPPVNCAPGL